MSLFCSSFPSHRVVVLYLEYSAITYLTFTAEKAGGRMRRPPVSFALLLHVIYKVDLTAFSFILLKMCFLFHCTFSESSSSVTLPEAGIFASIEKDIPRYKLRADATAAIEGNTVASTRAVFSFRLILTDSNCYTP